MGNDSDNWADPKLRNRLRVGLKSMDLKYGLSYGMSRIDKNET